MNTMSCMVIAVFVFFTTCLLYTQLMATARSMGQALYSVVYVTVPNSTVAQQIAREVVMGKYAACVNIVPTITSIYEWEGKLEEEKESLLIIKTKSAALDALKAKVLNIHPYKVPEFIALPSTYCKVPRCTYRLEGLCYYPGRFYLTGTFGNQIGNPIKEYSRYRFAPVNSDQVISVFELNPMYHYVLFQIESGSESFLQWIDKQVNS